MTAPHPLTPLLAPRSVAIFGASNDPTRISGRSLRYFREAGYQGGLYPINPTRDTVQGLRAYPDLASVPGEVDFAADRGAGQSRGRGDGGLRRQGRARRSSCSPPASPRSAPRAGRMQERITQIAVDSGIRLCGPNCLGLFNMRIGHTPTFSSFLEEGPTPSGPLGMVTQSGAFGTHLLALTARRGISVGVWLSTGNEAEVSVADGISFLADDPETTAIACYVEAIKDGAAFADAVARARANGKPVIAMKVGGSEIGAAAAASHTASLAGSDAVYDAALRQLGVERAKTPEDLVEIAYACTRGRLPRSRTPRGDDDVGRRRRPDGRRRRGGGARADPARRRLAEGGARAGSRSPRRATRSMSPRRRSTTPRSSTRASTCLLGKEKFPSMVGFFTTWASSPQMAEPLFKSVSGGRRALPRQLFRAVGDRRPEMQRRYEAAGVGVYEDPWRAVAGGRRRDALRRAPRHAAACRCRRCRRTCRRCRKHALGEHEAKAILAAAGVPILDRAARDQRRRGAAAAARLGDRLVLKIVSPRDHPQDRSRRRHAQRAAGRGRRRLRPS